MIQEVKPKEYYITQKQLNEVLMYLNEQTYRISAPLVNIFAQVQREQKIEERFVNPSEFLAPENIEGSETPTAYEMSMRDLDKQFKGKKK